MLSLERTEFCYHHWLAQKKSVNIDKISHVRKSEENLFLSKCFANIKSNMNGKMHISACKKTHTFRTQKLKFVICDLGGGVTYSNSCYHFYTSAHKQSIVPLGVDCLDCSRQVSIICGFTLRCRTIHRAPPAFRDRYR